MLLKPAVKLDKITDLSADVCRKYGLRALILDVDNTLSTHHGQQLTDGLEDWLRERGEDGIRLIVLSNSKRERVEPFAKKIGLPFISFGLKPLPFRFYAALRALGTKRRETAIVGDQIFTDVLGGHLAGVKTVLLTPILPEKALRFRLKRKLEKLVFRLYHIQNTEE
ncbi:MAG: YqeG family HAD IIIA-type phosphatase [Clostridia bacterium]|nr:YqeG family HAD IIIA-type phosphatase [Clostridia bacterium]